MAIRAAALAAVLGAALAAKAAAGDVVVIVHPERAIRLEVAEVAQIFLKQRRFWDDGDAIVPVNREPGSAARDAFVQRVFGARARQLVVYWNRQYFLGVLPPATLASDEAVRRFVAGERRAVGYVARSAVDASVRVALELPGPAPPGEPQASSSTWARPASRPSRKVSGSGIASRSVFTPMPQLPR